jgi:hypothetical protein
MACAVRNNPLTGEKLCIAVEGWEGHGWSHERGFSGLALGCFAVTVLLGTCRARAEAPAAAVAGFNTYVGAVEARLAEQHRAADGFLAGQAGSAESSARLRRGEVMVEQVTPVAGAEMPEALLHHWRGTAFAAGARAADFERILRDFNGYARTFAPQVMQAKTVAQDGDRVEGWMRMRPRYGFYVDHMVDIFGSAALMIGLACSGLVHWQVALAMLVAFLLLSGESYLATYTLGQFELSQGLFGPTELRILLVMGNLALLRSPYATVLGHRFLLFDLGGAVAAAGMVAMAVVVSVRHAVELYRQEPLP